MWFNLNKSFNFSNLYLRDDEILTNNETSITDSAALGSQDFAFSTLALAGTAVVLNAVIFGRVIFYYVSQKEAYDNSYFDFQLHQSQDRNLQNNRKKIKKNIRLFFQVRYKFWIIISFFFEF